MSFFFRRIFFYGTLYWFWQVLLYLVFWKSLLNGTHNSFHISYVLVLGGDLLKLYIPCIFCIRACIVKIYEWLRRTNGRQLWIYRLFVLFSITPINISVSCANLITFKNMGWFQFIGISYLTFRVVQIIIEMYDGVIVSISPSDFAEFLIFFPTLVVDR